MSSCFRLSIWTTAGRTRLPSPESLPLWRHIPHLVSLHHQLSSTPAPVPESPLTTPPTGLQTPRLKRLAEIVSQQAIAQQEKLEYGSEMGEEGEYDDGQSAGDMTQVDQAEQASQASRPASMAASAA